MEQVLSNILTNAGFPEGKLTNLSRKLGGTVAETWAFDWLSTDSRQELILRLSRNEDADNPIGIDKMVESQIQQAAYNKGVPTPKVRLILRGSEGIGVGYIMDFVKGETIPKRILRDQKYLHAREKMTQQCARILSDIHSIDVSCLPPLEKLSAQSLIHQYRSKYDFIGENHPVFELAFSWLEKNAPKETESCFVHGDFRIGNFIVGPEGIRSILDWELAHLGNPMEDLGWICVNSWRFGNIDYPVGGFGSREELFRTYELYSGRKVDTHEVHFWEVFGTLKWGIVCLQQAFTYLNGLDGSVELVAIGRRVSETEIDLLHLIS